MQHFPTATFSYLTNYGCGLTFRGQLPLPMAKILIVDDEPPILMLEKFILEQAGHTISEAYNGQDALKALGVDPSDLSTLLPDLIVLDVMMPLLDGYNVSLKMKDHPRARTVPIIV